MKVKLSLRLMYLVLLIVFVAVFSLGALIAYYTPYSGRAYLEHGIAPVYSRVGGVIAKIYRQNGEVVAAGDPLFQLDDRNFRAEVERLQALRDTMKTQLEALDFQIQEERENLLMAEKKRDRCQADLERDGKLLAKRAIAAKSVDESRLKFDVAERETAAIAAKLESLKRQRGNTTEENSELKRLQAELDIARNNWDDTVIRAPIAGILSYHQLFNGQAVNVNEKYAVVHDVADCTVNVDFMEKSAGRARAGQSALVAFDAIPGKLFCGRVKGFVRELESGYTAPTAFNRIEEDTRWIRAVGRNRVQIALDEPLPPEVALATGARAAVTLMNPECPLLSRLSNDWILLVSWSNFVY